MVLNRAKQQILLDNEFNILKFRYRKVTHYLREELVQGICHFVGNKAKGQISKRVFQENKPRQIFRKTNISYSLKRT